MPNFEDQTVRFAPGSSPYKPANNPSGTKLLIFDGDKAPAEYDLRSFGKNIITFGRNPENNDIVLTSKIASRQHGYFELRNGRIFVYDQNSMNGLILNSTYIQSAAFGAGDVLRIDDPKNNIQNNILMMLNTEEASSWKSMRLDRDVFTIGRAAGNSLQLGHISVSSRHARIVRNQGRFILYDENSTNGTYVNGIKVTGARPLSEKDVIIITNTKLIFSNGYLFYCTYTQGIGIHVSNIVKHVKQKRKSKVICNGVTLDIRPAELVAIIGGSGAGKTTLMNAICGYNKPTSGQVIINGESLYDRDTYEALKNIIGYVPQQDIVYDNLTLFDMLNYAAKLRLPDDVTREERENRVLSVIQTVELTEQKDNMIRSLSGGQKKRASIAVELLSDPQLFFLDEPASGLDPGTERNLMNTLKNMTKSGKTVILVTHSTLNLQNCDKILFMGKGGNLCYAGDYESAEKFFEVDNLVDVYNMITDNPLYWRRKYDSIAAAGQSGRIAQGAGGDRKNRAKRDKHSPIKQIGVLSARYAKLLLNDRQRLGMLLAQAPFLALLISLVKDGNQFENYGITKSLLFALSCSAFWIGTLNAIQEVCKERVILRREYMTGLKLGPYIISKFVVLGVLSIIQSLLLTGVFYLTVGAPEQGVMIHPFPELFLTTFLTAISASAMGIFASSLFKNPDRAMTVAPLLLMPQILFSGLLFKLEGVTKIISWFAICRWSMEGYGTIADLNGLKYMVEINGEMTEIAHEAEDFFEYTAGHLTRSWLYMLIFVIVFAVLSGISLMGIRKDR